MRAPRLLKTFFTAFGIFWGLPVAVLVGLAACPLIVIFLVLPALYELKLRSNEPNGPNVEVGVAGVPEIRFLVPTDYLRTPKDTSDKRVLTLHYGFPSMASRMLASRQSWWRKSGVMMPPLEDRNYPLSASLFKSTGDTVNRIVQQLLDDQSRERLPIDQYTTRLLSFKPLDVELTTYRFRQPGVTWDDRFDDLVKGIERRSWQFIHVPLSRKNVFIQCFDTHMGLGLHPVCEVVTEMEIKGKMFGMRYTIEDYLIPYWKEYDQRLRVLVTSFAT